MNQTRTFARQVGWEQKSFWRNPSLAAFTFAFPLLFLVVFIAINGNDTVHLPGGPVPFAQFYVPAIVAFGLISASYTNLAFTLSTRRDNGLLKRVRGTPLRPALYLAGMGGNVVVTSVILTLLVTTLGVVAYGVTFPDRYLGLVVALVFGAFCFAAIGSMVSTFVPNEDAAPAIINFVLFPMLFISGTFGRIDATSTLGRIASVFPVWHLNQLLQGVFNPNTTGTGVVASHVAVLTAWGVGALLVAARRFRWEPRAQ
ncbi:MAG: ABC transporter permease [Acidimicrobiia bacterium]